MNRLSFINLALLGGLAAIAIPILIHLLFKRPRRQMRFSTIQFFVTGQKEAARRRKLRHWLLLLTRCLLIALVVVAFSRPFLHQTSSAAHRPSRDLVLVIDRSASMSVGNRWPSALANATRILRDLGIEDRAALVEASAPARVLSPLAPIAKVQSFLRQLTAGFGAGDLAQGVNEAVRLLQQRGPRREATIVVISDFQRQSTRGAREIKVPRHFGLQLSQVGDMVAPNVAISGLSLEPSGSLRLEVSAFGEGVPSALSATLQVDGQFYTNCALQIGTTSSLLLALPTLSPGWHTLEAKLLGTAGEKLERLDSLAEDNQQWLVFDIPEPTRVIVAESRPSSREFEEESFFLMSALGSLAASHASLRCDRITVEHLLTALGRTGNTNIVILPGLRLPNEQLGLELRRFVADGGGLILFLGEAVAASRYEKAFKELLPAELRRMEGDTERPEEYWHIGDFEKNGLAFAAFQPENNGDPTRAAFFRRFALRDNDGSVVFARFADGSPFLITKQFGQGRVVLVNTTANTAWTDWPKRRTFVPWLQGLVDLAAGHPLKGTPTMAPRLACGTETRMAVGSAAPVRLRYPGRSLELRPREGEVTVLAEQPGVYAFERASGRPFLFLTASVPQAESNLEAMTTEEFLRMVTRVNETESAGSVLALLGDDSRELWRFLLLAGLLLLVAEFWLANRTWA